MAARSRRAAAAARLSFHASAAVGGAEGCGAAAMLSVVSTACSCSAFGIVPVGRGDAGYNMSGRPHDKGQDGRVHLERHRRARCGSLVLVVTYVSLTHKQPEGRVAASIGRANGT